MANTIITKTTSIIDIIIGDSTHHQLQSIYPVSFSAINTMVSNPVKPIPLLEDELLFDIAFVFGIKKAVAPSLVRQMSGYGFKFLMYTRLPNSAKTILQLI